jgi:hypothetical protein
LAVSGRSAGKQFQLRRSGCEPGVAGKHVFRRELNHDAIFDPELIKFEQLHFRTRTSPEVFRSPTLANANSFDCGAFHLHGYQRVERERMWRVLKLDITHLVAFAGSEDGAFRIKLEASPEAVIFISHP